MTKKYTSVTKLVNKYKEPFDTKAVAKKVAAKTGQKPEAIEAQWKKVADDGTSFHEKVESWFNGVPNEELGFLKTFSSQGECHPEVYLKDDQFMVHGVADLMVEKPDGTWILIDWKTNSKIWRSSFGDKKMKCPIGHLKDCNYVHYSLQLALYAELSGKKVTERYIVHVPKGNISQVDIIPALDLTEEAKLILSNEKANLS